MATVLFACMGVCVKKASAEVSTAEVVFFRGFVGAVMMAALAWTQGLELRTKVPKLHLWRGFAGVSALSLWFYAIAQLPLATAVTLNYTSPLFVALLLALWFKERIGPMLFAAVGLGFLLVGNAVFRVLGISAADFQTAGGILLLVLSIHDLLSSGKGNPGGIPTVGAVPIGTPLIVGPAALATLALLVQNYGYTVTLAALGANMHSFATP